MAYDYNTGFGTGNGFGGWQNPRFGNTGYGFGNSGYGPLGTGLGTGYGGYGGTGLGYGNPGLGYGGTGLGYGGPGLGFSGTGLGYGGTGPGLGNAGLGWGGTWNTAPAFGGYGVTGPGFGGYGLGFGPGFSQGVGTGFGPGFDTGAGFSQQFNTTGLPDDTDIVRMIHQAIDYDPLIPGDADIEVKSDAGIVTLTGKVRNKRVKHAAGQDAWWINGVTDVMNNITVTPRNQPQKSRSQQQQKQPQAVGAGS